MMKQYIVLYTSTETLFDEEKQRRQNSITVRAKDENDARNKVLKQLTESGRHDNIVINSVRPDPKGKSKGSALILIVGLLLVLLIITSILSR